MKKQRVLGQRLFRFKFKIYVVQILVKKQKVAVLDKSLAFCLLTSGAQRGKGPFANWGRWMVRIHEINGDSDDSLDSGEYGAFIVWELH